MDIEIWTYSLYFLKQTAPSVHMCWRSLLSYTVTIKIYITGTKRTKLNCTQDQHSLLLHHGIQTICCKTTWFKTKVFAQSCLENRGPSKSDRVSKSRTAHKSQGDLYSWHIFLPHSLKSSISASYWMIFNYMLQAARGANTNQHFSTEVSQLVDQTGVHGGQQLQNWCTDTG